eukprot:GHVL01011416.1.p2 GENE.GHVL01011416.1~~GHVL01011416.1.p2  ORF type:complete len:181 (+),score=24.75 GHVL01011416.1:82-624(+)
MPKNTSQSVFFFVFYYSIMESGLFTRGLFSFAFFNSSSWGPRGVRPKLVSSDTSTPRSSSHVTDISFCQDEIVDMCVKPIINDMPIDPIKPDLSKTEDSSLCLKESKKIDPDNEVDVFFFDKKYERNINRARSMNSCCWSVLEEEQPDDNDDEIFQKLILFKKTLDRSIFRILEKSGKNC